MKKSFLWTAAGVVTATALWAALSLPSHCPIPQTRTVAHAQPLVVSSIESSLTFRFPMEALAFTIKNTESAKITWDGRTMTISCFPASDHPRLIRLFPRSSQVLRFEVEKRHSETGPQYSRSSISRFPRTALAGQTITVE